MAMSSHLTPELITQYLSDQVKQGLITVLPTVDSTNRWLLTEGSHADICVAEQQSAGRGRRERVWQSPAGENIYLSLRWHFPILPRHYSWLSLMVAVAVVEVLQQMGLSGHHIKWPNDIYYQNKKLGGILLQTAHPIEQSVIGIGLNVNMEQDMTQAIDQPWCSLRQVTGKIWDRNLLIANLVQALLSQLEVFSLLSVEQMQYRWQPWDSLHQRSVNVQANQRTIRGIACGLDSAGRLLVLDEQNELQTFSSADVSVRL